MIKRCLLLTKMLLKTTVSTTLSTQSGTNKSNKKRKLATIGLAIVFLYLFVIVAFISYELISSLKEINQASSFVGCIIAANIIMDLFLTLLSSANILYFSKDTASLLPLPFSSSEIVSAKLNQLIVTEYFTELFLGVAPLTIYGILTGGSALYYIFMIIVLIFVPIIPIILASLIVMVLMAFTKTFKNKGLVQTITVIFSICLGFGISMFVQYSEPVGQEELLVLITKANGLVETLYHLFPTIRLACEALINIKIVPLLGLIVASVIFYVLVVVASKPLYFRGVIGSMFSGKKTKGKVKKEDYKHSNVGYSYVMKEFKSLFRRPVYFTQCVLPYFLIPVLIIFSTVIGFKSNGDELDIFELGTILASIPDTSKYIYIVSILLLLLLGMFSFSQITNISRDGHNATFMKYIPISFSSQLFYKSLPGYLLSLIPECIVVIALAIFLRIEIVPILFGVLTYAILNVSISLLSIIYETHKPKLNWSNEMQVVKSNLSVMIVMVIVSLLSIPYIVLLIKMKNINYALVIILSITFALLTATASVVYILKKDNELAKNIY